MIEVELKSSYQNTKEMPKIDNSDTLNQLKEIWLQKGKQNFK